MPNASPAFGRVLTRIEREIKTSLLTIQVRGFKYFQRIFIASALLIFVAYKIYQFAGSSLDSASTRLESAVTAAHYADRYQNAEDDLKLAQSRLPPTVDQGVWLTDFIRSSLDAEGLTPESISEPRTSMPPGMEQGTQASGISQETVQVKFSSKFVQLVAWLNQVEHSRYLVRVSSLNLSKKSLDISEIDCELSTLVAAGSD